MASVKAKVFEEEEVLKINNVEINHFNSKTFIFVLLRDFSLTLLCFCKKLPTFP